MSTNAQGVSSTATLWTDRDEPEWMAALRRKAFEEFSRAAWPTPQEEEWRRTDVTALDFGKYRLIQAEGGAVPAASQAGESDALSAQAIGEESGLIRFQGGRCVLARIEPSLAAKGVRFLSLTEAIKDRNPAIEESFREAIDRSVNRFQSWHYSQWSHGAFLYVPQFLEIKDPFFIDFVETGAEAFSAPHVTVVLDKGARAVVIQRIASGDGGELLCNEGADLKVGDGGALEFVRVQDLNLKSRFFNNSSVGVARDGSLKHFEVVFGSRLHKSRLDCSINGQGGEVHINGIYFAHKRQHMDIGTIQRHNAPNANSRAYYKGAVRDKAKTVYQGLIEVGIGASQTDAYLKNKNLLLNDGARSDSIPMLKINNNDVKCSHGSTTGKLNEEELFYLTSRGFPRTEAEKLLIAAFFEDVMESVHEAVKEEIRHTILKRVGETTTA